METAYFIFPLLVAHLAFQNLEMQIAVAGMSQRKEFKVVIFRNLGQMADTVSDLIDWYDKIIRSADQTQNARRFQTVATELPHTVISL